MDVIKGKMGNLGPPFPWMTQINGMSLKKKRVAYIWRGLGEEMDPRDD